MRHERSESREPRRTYWHDVPLTSVCNDTKWEGLRRSISALNRRPSFRTMDINGHYASSDSEWLYHFRMGGYSTTRYVDLFCSDEEMSEAVLAVLRANQASGHAIEGGFRVYGYTLPGEAIAKF